MSMPAGAIAIALALYGCDSGSSTLPDSTTIDISGAGGSPTTPDSNTTGELTERSPLTPANCAGYIERVGIDANGNGVLENAEITSTMKIYEQGTPLTHDELEAMICQGADVSAVNTCKITDMSYLFYYNTTFNQPIGKWDVSSVTNMGSMFSLTEAFNQPIGSWDVSSVTYMTEMFCLAKAFNQDISGWVVYQIGSNSWGFAGPTLQTEYWPNFSQ